MLKDGKYTDIEDVQDHKHDNLYDRLLNFYDLDIDNNLRDMRRKFSS